MAMIQMDTARLRLRSFQDTDLGDLLQICSDVDAMRHIPPFFLPEPREETVLRLQRYLEHEALHGFSFYHVTDRSGCFVGRAGFYWIPEIELFEVGYSLLPAFWGMGYATELTLRLIEFAFRDRGLEGLCGRTIPDHRRSQRVLEKAGFSPQGLKSFEVKGRMMDLAYFTLRA
jgi:[ribosomal protein S5]-alanine N-acetyltransferase